MNHRGRGIAALGAACALVVSLVSGSGSTSDSAGPVVPAVAEASDAVTAAFAARRQGSRVEVADQRTETRTVYANPDGRMSAELTVAPTRVRSGTSWVNVDTTLAAQPDGSVAPKAVARDLTLSGGGSAAPLVRLAKDGKAVALYWPTALPEPVLSGADATYPQVLPGVDLVIRAEVSGYRQLLVIKDAEAATNPALARIPMRIAVDGVRLTVDDSGGLRVVDEAGTAVFVAAPSVMWDSGGSAPVPVGVVVDSGTLTLVPDQAFLADPATVYPVTVDPDLKTVEHWGRWATVLSGNATTSYWQTSGEHPWSQVGQCHRGPPNHCDGIDEARGFFQFDTGWLNGKDIQRAVLNTVVVYGATCGAWTHQLYMAWAEINPSLNWNNKPGGVFVSAAGAEGVRGTCPGNKTPGFEATGRINKVGPTAFWIQAEDVNAQDAWRKYDPAGAKLQIWFNTRPNLPTNPRTIPNLPAPCHWCAGWSYVGDREIRFAATLSDPDPGDMLHAAWRFAVNGVQAGVWDGPRLVNGVEHSTDPINLDGMDGKAVNWWVHTVDDLVGSDATPGPRSFMVDRTPPAVEPKVSAALYKEENAWHGGVGVEDTFTFEANGVGDINHYEYGWTDEPTTQVLATGRLSGPASVRLTPPGDGPRTLFVRSVDRAGHRSKTAKYRIYVRAGNGPYTQYSFEGNANDSAFLGDRDGTLSGGATYTPGAMGTALLLDGRIGSTMTARNSVRTDTSFSVSAWVRPDDLPRRVMGAVSQDSEVSGGSSGWFLNYRDDGQGPKWTFMIMGGVGGANPGPYLVSGPQIPQKGKWTQLTGVYDRYANQLRLYVDGAPAGQPVTLPAGFVSSHASGPLVVGREQWQGSLNDPWLGAIDEVAVHDRALSDAEVRTSVSRDNVQVAHWQFEDPAGTTAKNSVTGGEHGVLTGDAEFIDDGAVGRAVHVNGGDGQVVTSGPAMRTDQSFSVAAWVWADRLVTAGASMTAVSQDGNANSGFYLKYDSGHQKWAFAKMTTDDNTPSSVAAVASQSPITGDWVHLAGVFDAQAKTLRIYVNGEDGGSATIAGNLWTASGPVAIGRAKLRGDEVDFWPGRVDEVRMYSRVLTIDEIKGIVAQNNVTAGSWKLDGSFTDDSGRNLGGTPDGGPTWTAGQTSVPDSADLAGLFDGVDDSVHAATTVDTAGSFSVAAWVRPDKPGRASTVVSQDASAGSAFAITAGGDGRWHLDVLSVAGGVAAGSVQYGVWTHVAGVYSLQRKKIELYVNGVLIGQKDHLGWPRTTGEWQIGRVRLNNAYRDYFAGAIDDVVAYSRPLFAEEVRVMAGRDLTLVHNWALDEGSGTTATDSIGARGGALSGGAGYVPGKLGNAVRFDGVDDSVATQAIDLATDQSFTVSAWIRLDRAECPANECRKDAVSIDGGGPFSKLRLGHIQNNGSAPNGKWIFEMPEPDGTVTEAAITRAPGEVGEWVFLVGVYDAPSKKIWLYVNANRIDDGTLRTAWKSTGGLRIGRATVNGGPAAFWEGSVDDVRLYSTLLDKDRITALFRSYPTDAATPNLPVADAGHWKFDENTGTVTADASGRGRPATLRGGAGWFGGRQGNTSWLDGTAGYAETDVPVLTTNQSFSVTAWAYLTRTTGGNRVVVAQDRTQVSSFLLLYDEATAKWAAAAPTADPANQNTIVVRSATPAVAGGWAHLGAVYDASLHQLRLYVNGVPSGAQTGVSIMDSAGRFSIGRGRWSNANASFFPGGVDDVRAFGRALSDGEVRKIHDSAPLAGHGRWGFEGTPDDLSWRKNPTTLSGTWSYTAGIRGQALALDGRTGAATAERHGANPVDSFAVSAWAKLSRTDQDSTIVGQDGSRTSGFLLQYNKNVGRWVFGAPVQDADGAELVYAYSPQAPTVDAWTHLTGVYDHAGRQFRLYVNGVLAGVRDNAQVTPTWSGFSIGRGKVNGEPAGFFAGALDEVQTDLGIPTDDEIRTRGGHPAPAGGQLGRFAIHGDHASASSGGTHWDRFGPVPTGYRYEGTMGKLLPAEAPNTTLLYACRSGIDGFTSADPNCENQEKLGELGWIYTQPPAGVATIALYRCAFGSDRFDTVTTNCEGQPAPGTLHGYTIAYTALVRYVHPFDVEHTVTVYGAQAGYRSEGTLGLLSMIAQPDTQSIYTCRAGLDQFVSLDSLCENGTAGASMGRIWKQAPAGKASMPIYRCHMTDGERFVSNRADCEGNGNVQDLQLGHVLTAVPAPAA